MGQEQGQGQERDPTKLRLPDLMALLGADTAHKWCIRRLAVEGAPLACVVRPRQRHEVTQTRCEQFHGVPLPLLPLPLPKLLPGARSCCWKMLDMTLPLQLAGNNG